MRLYVRHKRRIPLRFMLKVAQRETHGAQRRHVVRERGVEVGPRPWPAARPLVADVTLARGAVDERDGQVGELRRGGGSGRLRDEGVQSCRGFGEVCVDPELERAQER